MSLPGWRPRAALRDVRAYDTDAVPCELMLADNTPDYGAPPAAREAVAAAASPALAQYPTTYSRPLREAIAAYIGVAPDEVMVGCGSDEVLATAFTALGEPGDRVAHMDPTFVMARVFATIHGLQPVPVPLTPDHDADAEALLRAAAPLTYVCTPNNPTGRPLAAATLDRLRRDVPGVLLIDEAYGEFAGTNLAREAPAHGRSLVFRTFSKAFGLAGLRVGYAVGARPLIAELEKARGPYTVSAPGERAARAALEHDLGWVRARVADVVATRDAFVGALRGVGLAPLPTAANFVLLPVRDAAGTAGALRARGILVRHFTALPGIGDALRITIGAPAAMARVLEALRAALAAEARPLRPTERIDA